MPGLRSTYIRVRPPHEDTGLARHLVATALSLHPECRKWHIRTVVEDGPSFWPHVCPTLEDSFGVTFRLHLPDTWPD